MRTGYQMTLRLFHAPCMCGNRDSMATHQAPTLSCCNPCWNRSKFCEGISPSGAQRTLGSRLHGRWDMAFYPFRLVIGP